MAALQTWKVTEPYIKISCGLGEAPFYETDTHRLRFFDIVKGKMHVVDLGRGPDGLSSFDVGGAVSTSAAIEGTDEEIIVGARAGFATMERRSKKMRYVKEVWEVRDGPGKKARMRFNDGCVDPQGRYWAGTMNDPLVKAPTDEGVLFRLDPDMSLHRMIENVTIPNGMGWSLDGKTMYFTDSPTRNIFKYKFDGATGGISDRKIFYHAEGDAVPDGFAMDVDGCLWIAICGGGKVLKVTAEGKLAGEISLPTRMITCPGFVGEDLFITSAEEEEPEKYPDSVEFGGSLFKVNVGVQGLSVHRFKRYES